MIIRPSICMTLYYVNSMLITSKIYNHNHCFINRIFKSGSLYKPDQRQCQSEATLMEHSAMRTILLHLLYLWHWENKLVSSTVLICLNYSYISTRMRFSQRRRKIINAILTLYHWLFHSIALSSTPANVEVFLPKLKVGGREYILLYKPYHVLVMYIPVVE